MGPFFMRKRIGYIRVSTDSGEQLAALENQRSRIEAVGVDEILCDVQSGRERDRDGYQRLLELITQGLVSEVVITRIDRLGRDAADADAVIAFAARRGVTITALDGGTIESITPTGFVMSRIMTTMSEVESRMLSQRIRAGLAERRKRRMPCRGRAPWGYRISADRTAIEPDPVEFPRAQEFLRILARVKCRMATALDVWESEGRGTIPLSSCRSVRSWLLNPTIRGGIGYNQRANHQFEEIVWDMHEALISHEEYEYIEQQLSANRRMWGRHAETHQRLLTSLCRCGDCGRVMNYVGGRTIPSVMCRIRGCPQRYKSVREFLISGAIVHTIADHAAALLRSEPVTVSPEALELQAAIRRLEALADPDLEPAIEAKRARLASLRQGPRITHEQLERLSDPSNFGHASYEETVALFHRFVAQVVVANKAVQRVDLRF